MNYNKNPIRLVGYWNGDENNPDIVFIPPDNELKRKKYSLVVIELTEPFEREDSAEIKQLEKTVNKIESYNSKVSKKFNDASNSLKKLNKIMKRFK